MNSKRGKDKLTNLIKLIKDLKKVCKNVDFGGDDITKILIKKNGLTGYQLSEILYERFSIEDEITNDISTMLLTGLGTTDKKLKKLKRALTKI